MDKVYSNLGGRPGFDCGGFCKFCFFKNVDFQRLESLNIGCVNCPPDQIGCDYCRNIITGVKNGFKPISYVLMDVQNKLMQRPWDALNGDLKVVVHADADVFSYPDLMVLVSMIKQTGLPLHLGYTSGKAIKNESFAQELISKGLDELTFSAFCTDPEIRGKWMRDKNPEVSLKSLKLFCQTIDVHASVVVVPGVNDQEKFFQTCSDLEEWGIKSLILRRFGNLRYQGLIFNYDQPVAEGIIPPSYEEFKELVEQVSREFSFKLTSFPLYDPEKDFPFAILNKKNQKYLEQLPEIHGEATVITGKLAGPYLEKFFSAVDEFGLVNVVSVEKEIADLITPEDLETIDLSRVQKEVILPRGALVHQKQALEILGRDGTIRKIKRGPYNLTHPYHENLDFNEKELLDFEFKAFEELINIINH
ncbi:MAG: Radical SAM superfamily protein [Methanobacterium sp. PtaU1.Bin097]|nr:MAG: Radical SAM superfamily protein [Methanobacterium sp. PtaU1.Bin097]